MMLSVTISDRSEMLGDTLQVVCADTLDTKGKKTRISVERLIGFAVFLYLRLSVSFLDKVSCML